MLMVVLLASSFYLEVEGAPNPYRPYGGGAQSKGGYNGGGIYHGGGGVDAQGGFAAGGGSVSGGGSKGFYRGNFDEKFN
ncbi:hypothetical protein Avbf_02626 [Armadillidium vulgare]|nr:hypothetical protein Avbf_02626 [Armadillidium vulgare]